MHEDVEISPEFKSIDRDVVAALPKVVLCHPVAPADVATQLKALADDGVVYAELRISATNEDDLHTAIAAMTDAESAHGIVARIVLDVRNEADARLAVEHRGMVVGCGLTGEWDEKVLEFLRENFLPVSIAAGSEDSLDSVYSAVVTRADRIAGAVSLYEDFTVEMEGIAAGPLSAFVRDREIPLELSLSADVAAGIVEEVGDHPLPLLQQLGFNCTLNPCGPTLMDEMMILVEAFDYGLEELFDLTVNAIEAAFAPIELRRLIMTERIAPAYQGFADSETFADSQDDEEI